jgi:hypothetical protein
MRELLYDHKGETDVPARFPSARVFALTGRLVHTLGTPRAKPYHEYATVVQRLVCRGRRLSAS